MPSKKETSVRKNKKMPTFYQAIGRRKRATARVRLFPVIGEKITVNNVLLGQNDMYVNGKNIKDYFRGMLLEKRYMEPFIITKTTDRFAATIKVIGSGLISQLGAITHGISRALIIVDKENYRPILKKAGFLTRDPREKERRKPGLAGKARAAKQSPKR